MFLLDVGNMYKIDAEIGHLLQELPPEPLKTEQEPSTRQGDPFKQEHARKRHLV